MFTEGLVAGHSSRCKLGVLVPQGKGSCRGSGQPGGLPWRACGQLCGGAHRGSAHSGCCGSCGARSGLAAGAPSCLAHIRFMQGTQQDERCCWAVRRARLRRWRCLGCCSMRASCRCSTSRCARRPPSRRRCPTRRRCSSSQASGASLLFGHVGQCRVGRDDMA